MKLIFILFLAFANPCLAQTYTCDILSVYKVSIDVGNALLNLQRGQTIDMLVSESIVQTPGAPTSGFMRSTECDQTTTNDKVIKHEFTCSYKQSMEKGFSLNAALEFDTVNMVGRYYGILQGPVEDQFSVNFSNCIQN